jgi:hypothetical protein
MRRSTKAGVTTDVKTADFKRLFDKSSQVDKKLKTALRRNIRKVGSEAVEAVRNAVGTGPSIRSNIAAGVQLKVMTGTRAGVAIVASSSQMEPGKERLVRAWEASKGWRHPVFATDAWVPQQGNPYFRKTIFSRRAQVRAVVEQAMQEALKSLEN